MHTYSYTTYYANTANSINYDILSLHLNWIHTYILKYISTAASNTRGSRTLMMAGSLYQEHMTRWKVMGMHVLE